MIFVAGVMQGSRLGNDLEDQEYRARLKRIIRNRLPDVAVFDPLDEHRGSIEYDDVKARRTFLRHIELAAGSSALVAYLPTASMGTAIEMYEARLAGVPVWSITPMRTNWIVRLFSDEVFDDLDQFERWLGPERLLLP